MAARPSKNFGAVAPAAVLGIGQRHPFGIARIPGVFRHAGFLGGGLSRERRQRRTRHGDPRPLDGRANLSRYRIESIAVHLSADHYSRSAFINSRSDFGIGFARPSLMKATRTSALTSTSPAAPHLLRQRDRGALYRDRPCHHVEHVIHPRGPHEIEMHRANHEGKARGFLLRLFEQRVLLGAHQPQMVGASALHEAQIIGVIDDAGKIGVLVVDAICM